VRTAKSIVGRFVLHLSAHPDLTLRESMMGFVSGFKANSYRYAVIYYLRKFFDFVPVMDNPAQSLSYPQVNPTVGRKYLTRDEVQDLFRHLKKRVKQKQHLREYAIGQLILFTGLRANEVLGLLKQDLKHCQGGYLLTIRDSKTKQSRFALFPDSVHGLIVRFHQAHPRENPHLFYPLTWKTSPLSYSALIKVFNQIFTGAGINGLGVGLHALRHTYVRALEEETQLDIEVLQQLLGHSALATTRLYRRIFNQDILRRGPEIQAGISRYLTKGDDLWSPLS